MARIQHQELLAGVRIDWLDTGDAPESLRSRVRTEVQQLSDHCGKMRAMSIENRAGTARIVCNCLGRKLAIRVARPTLLETLWAFAQTASARCW